MAIDNLLGNMHQDRKYVSDEQLRESDEQRTKREQLSLDQIAEVKAQIAELTEQILQLESKSGMQDFDRRERRDLERERRELRRSLPSNDIQSWRDTQILHGEERHVRKEAREEEQRYERMNKTFYGLRSQQQ